MFENVIGHDKIKSLFLDNDYVIRNTYIFEGSSGIGKKMMAMEIANKIAQYQQNILLIQSDKALGVDDIRPINDFVYRFPFGKDNKRVVIIDNCNTMNSICQNMLLKLLENPPEFVVFFLISSDSSNLLDTIISRANVLRFFGATVDEIYNLLSDKVSNDSFRRFISIILDGSIAGVININDNLEYFKSIYDCCNEIEKLNKEEDIFGVVTKINNIIKTANDMKYIYRWFSYLSREEAKDGSKKYSQYPSIIGNTMQMISVSGDSMLPIDIMLIKICKYNKKNK